MALLPRPVSPRSAFADLKLMFSVDRPHRWGLLGVSAALTGILIWGFLLDSRIPPKPREIIYFESWMSDRKDSDIIRQQKEDLARYEAALTKKQKEYQGLADTFGVDWKKEEADNRVRRAAAVAEMQKALDKKLAAALAREAAEASGGKASAGAARTGGTTR